MPDYKSEHWHDIAAKFKLSDATIHAIGGTMDHIHLAVSIIMRTSE
jgi:hypothetical protein